MEYYSATKRNEVLIHATTWINPETTLSERNQSHKVTYCKIPFISHVRNREIQRRLELREEVGSDCFMGERILLWGDKMLWNLIEVAGCPTP